MNKRILVTLAVLAGSIPLLAQSKLDRYGLILEDPPLTAQVSSRKALRASAAVEASAKIQAAQLSVRRLLAGRNIPVTGSVKTLANMVFVRASRSQAEQLRGLPGVAHVVYLPPLRLNLDKAVDLVNVQQAWTAAGGMENAGAGVKIGIIDTGIDQNHPAFQDSSLQMPPGFPKCRQQAGECAYTNNKVIAARSYVDMLVGADDPGTSRPDDTSPRDRVGHGTAVAMVAAGNQNKGPGATITGVAPKAYLGNYKILGSPGVNAVAPNFLVGDALIQAIDEAFTDEMDIVSISVGSPAGYGPLDAGAACETNENVPCDPYAPIVEAAVQGGMAVVVAAGNDGDFGYRTPALNTIHTPGTAPSAITVGASTNAHNWASSVRAADANAPSNVRNIAALLGDGPKPASTLTAPLRDVSQLQDDGKACSGLSAGSLTGALALIQRGNCSFPTKVNNAQKAGAVGVIIYQADGDDSLFNPSFLSETGIPAVLIGNTDGRALKGYLVSHSDASITIDPALRALDDTSDRVASFSSQGPSIGRYDIKPELVAVGTGMYTATQSYDPNGDMYEPKGYTAVDGTSFSAPMVAGALALVKQKHSDFGPAQLKSAVVNTASAGLHDDSGVARVSAVGAGKLNVEAAVRTNVVVEPATLSFGVITLGAISGAGSSRILRITNTGTDRLQLSLSIAVRDQNPLLTLTPNSLALEPGEWQDITVRIAGSLPPAGSYEGAITIQGGAVPLRVPYLYLVGDGSGYNVIPLFGVDFVAPVSDTSCGTLIGFKLIDRFGVPVKDAPVVFKATLGGGSIDAGDEKTDVYGIAAASVCTGPTIGDQQFTADVSGLKIYFDGLARLTPTIETNGVMNAASFERGKPVAPGSYITIFGKGLSDSLRVFSTPYLPLSLAGVSVSFDVPAKGLSLPGRLHFVSDGQVNVQVPWELQGINSVKMKVSIGDYSSALYDVSLADYAPAFFEYTEPGGRQFIAALDTNYQLIGSDHPAVRGQTVQLFANGLGPVDNQPGTGEISPSEPKATTRVLPNVTIGGRPARVEFSGLAPANIGLYQLNVVVPADIESGIQPVIIDANGIVSKTAMLPVQ